MKRLAWITMLVVGTLAVLWLLWELRDVAPLFLASLVLFAALQPAVDRIARRGLPHVAATALVFGPILLAAIVLAGALAVGISADLETAFSDADRAHRFIKENWTEGTPFQQFVARRVPEIDELSANLTQVSAIGLAREAFGWGGTLVGMMANLLMVVFLAMYWSFDARRFSQKWLQLLRPGARGRTYEVFETLTRDVGAYARSEAALGLASGLLTWMIFAWIELPYPAIVGAIVGLAWLIPWLGPAVAVSAIWIAAGLSFVHVTYVATIARGIIGSGIVLVLYALMAYLARPWLDRRENYDSLWGLFVALLLLPLMGIWGLIVGPPLAVASRIVGQAYFSRSSQEFRRRATNHIELAEELARLRAGLGAPSEAGRPELQSILQRMERALEKSRNGERRREATGEESPAPQPRAAEERTAGS
ncbi:MAG: AI-2E family transporter [Planctomycetota bacterium]